ncbi:hypothetical protein RHSIM_Rhsim05G0180800 [Rhododendron simsii]|uniref:F-box domain-containing protein n=1 Tax=Rhododendron simsii TaxID=118357 RepID=A0A834GUS0_RHOSS|nr:hypothetical protein RHSIM_Rhsim05G0180800 [Rhododendron simsii]
MAYIPTGLISNILSWLPVKPLLRFRCVSKPWRDLIDDRHFIRSHINRSFESKNNLSVILWDDDIYSLPFDSLNDAVTELDWPFKYSVDKTYFLGCCDGLVCLGIGNANAVIWNPATRKYRKLPVAPIEYPQGYVGEPEILFAIGYDSVTDDYKVVKITSCDFSKYDSEVRVYSMKLDSWRRVEDIPRKYYIQRGYGRMNVFVCGSLHWRLGPDHSIVAFDMAAEEHRLLPGPECKNTWIPGELGGCLCIFDNYVGLRIEAWVMKDYGVKESWTRMFSIPHDCPLSFEMAVPLTYSKDGGKVLLLQDCEKFVWYDIEHQVREDIGTLGLIWEYFEARMCVESLVPVKGGESDEKKQDGQGGRSSSSEKNNPLKRLRQWSGP